MRNALHCAVVLLVLSAAGCRSNEQKAQDERKEAVKEIGAAATKVQETEIDAAKEIREQTDPVKREDAKIEATEDLADAKKELGDEKAEATKEIAEADAGAGHGGTYKKD